MLTLLVGDFGEISSLDLGRDTVEGSAQGIFRRSVYHLLLDFGVVGRPAETMVQFPRGRISLVRSSQHEGRGGETGTYQA